MLDAGKNLIALLAVGDDDNVQDAAAILRAIWSHDKKTAMHAIIVDSMGVAEVSEPILFCLEGGCVIDSLCLFGFVVRVTLRFRSGAASHPFLRGAAADSTSGTYHRFVQQDDGTCRHRSPRLHRQRVGRVDCLDGHFFCCISVLRQMRSLIRNKRRTS